MHEEIVIHPMTASDIDSVFRIECASFRSPWSYKSLNKELTNKLAVYLVACQADNVVGYAGMWIIFDEAHITNVAVDDEYRHRGIGRKLMESMFSAAISRGAERMTLEVRENNVIAQTLYKSMGFAIAGIRKGYYTDTGEDGWLMWVDLIQK